MKNRIATTSRVQPKAVAIAAVLALLVSQMLTGGMLFHAHVPLSADGGASAAGLGDGSHAAKTDNGSSACHCEYCSSHADCGENSSAVCMESVPAGTAAAARGLSVAPVARNAAVPSTAACPFAALLCALFEPGAKPRPHAVEPPGVALRPACRVPMYLRNLSIRV